MTPGYPQPDWPASTTPPRGVAALGAPQAGRCVAALQLDGGTRIMRDFDPDLMTGELAELLELIRRPRSKADEARDREQGGVWARLPVPQLWGPAPYAQVRVGGERRHVVHLHVVDTAYILLDLERGTVQIQAKAKALWGYGWETWVTRWAGLVSWWVGEDLREASDAHRLGWRVTGIELCSDFVRVPIYLEDLNLVLAPGVPTRKAFPGKSYRPRDSAPESRGGFESSEAGEIETLNIGKRSSNVSWCLYRKTTQILAAKDGDASTYSPMWKAMGWDEEEEVTRVELRLCKRALVQLDEETGEQLDLRDPANLTHENLARVWASHTSKYRIIVQHGSTRRRRRATDPRWKVVQSVSSLSCELKQDRSVSQATWREATLRAAKSGLRAMQRLAALHGVSIVDPEGYGEVARMIALDHVRNETPDADELLTKYGETHCKARQEFIGHEMFRRQLAEPLPGTLLIRIEPPQLLPEEWRGAG